MNERVRQSLQELLGERCSVQAGALLIAPSGEQELAAVLRLLREQQAQLHQGLLLSRARMRRILSVDEKSALVRAEAGVRLEELERALAPMGLCPGPLSPGARALGLADVLEGPYAGLWATPGGRLEPISLSLTVMLPGGEVFHSHPSPRRASGPELDALFLGGEGRFGLVLSATVRCAIKPQASRPAAFSFPGVAHLVAALRGAIADGCCLERARAQKDGERAQLEAWVIGSAEGVEVDLASLSHHSFGRGARSSGRASIQPEGLWERELSWEEVGLELEAGRPLELFRLALSSVIARGAQAGLPLSGGEPWSTPPAVRELASLVDPTGALGGIP